MPTHDLPEFSEILHTDIAADAHAGEMLREHAFVERMSDILIDYGEIRDLVSCHWMDRGLKVDGYDLEEDFSSITLLVSQWLDQPDVSQARLTDTDVDRVLKRAVNFFTRCWDGKIKKRIDVSNPAYELAELIEECKSDLTSAKIILVTDGTTKERRARITEYDGIEVSSVIWDLQRTHSFWRTGKRETIEIDFQENYGGAIPCVAQPSPDGKYTTYLSFVAGDVLADLYKDWKIRLLERNVRVFLSQRPKVNQGIRDTIRTEPEMFCAYNNGITVYAQRVDLEDGQGHYSHIKKVHDFQIVNGGQTTASLYHTREKFKTDLSAISVQMKLMIINEEARPDDFPPDLTLADQLVPRIGRFSNTQNRVQMADLMANDPPHPELHTISQNLPAPDPSGGSVQTFWFYERSRGSYEETRRLTARTLAQQRKFDQKYPKFQRFDKSRFGKAWNSYRKLPHTVCLGSMKNFAHFNSWLQDQKNEDWTEFFKKSVALVILWKNTEKIVRRQKFGGYTHAIVAYTLSWFHELTDMRLDLAKIWVEQKIEESVLDNVEMLASLVNAHIRDTDRNVTEWCKRVECWDKLISGTQPDITDLKSAFIRNTSAKKYITTRSAEKENVAFCEEKGFQAWFDLAKWLKDHGFMSGKQRSQAFNMGRTLKNATKAPSSILAYACRAIWESAETSYGWGRKDKE